MRHFIDLLDWEGKELRQLLQDALRMKRDRRRGKDHVLKPRRVLGLIFEKPSLRTRVSFQTAMAHLGGASVFLSHQEVGLGQRESLPDVARTVSQFVDAVVLRTFHHATVVQFAQHATCPVINGLSDYYHPCQALGDLLTMREALGTLRGKTLVFVGDGNNVARSLAIGCAKLGMRFVLSAPAGYRFDAAFLDTFRKHVANGALEEIGDPAAAVSRADVVYTDVWTSMGQEDEAAARREAFAAYQVNAALLQRAPAHVRFMHCLPAHRGEEVTDEVIDSPASIVFAQAANRLHAQKSLLKFLLTRAKD
ncbi:MAG: ornithine carbamoyltransferase [Gemmataceae bacterium]|nr:ornithine carbamoyltransferase [Gemmataceae bacterium]